MIWHDQERARRLLLSRTHKKLIQLHTLSLPRNNLKESGHCQTGRKSQVRLISKSNERPKKKKSLPVQLFLLPFQSHRQIPHRPDWSQAGHCVVLEKKHCRWHFQFSILPVLPPFWLSPFLSYYKIASQREIRHLFPGLCQKTLSS